MVVYRQACTRHIRWQRKVKGLRSNSPPGRSCPCNRIGLRNTPKFKAMPFLFKIIDESIIWNPELILLHTNSGLFDPAPDPEESEEGPDLAVLLQVILSSSGVIKVWARAVVRQGTRWLFLQNRVYVVPPFLLLPTLQSICRQVGGGKVGVRQAGSAVAGGGRQVCRRRWGE